MDLEQLEKLNELKEKGILTEDEFNQKKKEILNDIPSKAAQQKNTNAADNSLWQYFITCIRDKYACFTGRARRKEYWSFILYYNLIMLAFGFICGLQRNIQLYNYGYVLFTLFFFIPSLSVSVRRFHDVNKSGWWLITLPGLAVPMVVMVYIIEYVKPTNEMFDMIMAGILCVDALAMIIVGCIFFYWLVKKGDEKENKYGPAPKGV